MHYIMIRFLLLSRHKRVDLINLLFYLIHNLISFKTSIAYANSEISLNETFQVFYDKNVSNEINYPEIFGYNGEFAVVNATFWDTFDDDDVKAVRKCCRNNEIYADKVCRVSSNVEKLHRNFRKEFNRTLKTSSEQGFHLCGAEDVIVEYDVSSFQEVTWTEDGLKVNGQGSFTDFCVDFSSEELSKLTVRTCGSKDLCASIPCVRKFCQGGEKLALINESSHCVPFRGNIAPVFYDIRHWQTKDEVLIRSDIKAFGVLQGQTCVKFLLDWSEEQYYLSNTDGRLYINGTRRFFDNHQYCHEIVDYGNSSVLEMFVCFEAEPQPSDRLWFIVGYCLSVLGFILTLLVYIFVLKVRNVNSKIVVCYCTSFLMAYSSLLVTQYLYAFSLLCMPFAYITYFSFMSGFTWLQVMCYDIWVKISSTSRPERKKSKRFRLYLIHATLLPTCLLSILVLCQHTSLLPLTFRPSFGEDYCWFQAKDKYPFMIFFLLPVGLMTSINVILFVLTMIHCNKIKMEIARVQRSSVKRKKSKAFIMNKAMLQMNAKLFKIMGLSWIMEILSAIFPHEYIWMITDFSNSLLGVYVFIIFVLKRRVLRMIKKKMGFQVPDDLQTCNTFASNRNRIVIQK